MPRLLDTLFAALTLCYPLLVYCGFEQCGPVHFAAWQLAAALLVLALARLLLRRHRPTALTLAAPLLLAAVALYSGLRQSPEALRYYPVLVNAALLAVFALSLRRPPSVIEFLARLREPELPPAAVAYTRRVTQVWCGFFLVNGAIALWTASAAGLRAWTLYNGLIAYLLMGALFCGEWLVRRRVRGGAR
jgi:uncharacterized membrane protein